MTELGKSPKEYFTGIGSLYQNSIEGDHHGLVINVLGGSLVLLAILVPVILKCDAFRKGIPDEGRRGSTDSSEESA